MIAVIDYGMGNLRSVTKAVELYTNNVFIARTPDEINNARALILPGDGAFAQAMENLEQGGWKESLINHINQGGFLLGICLGFQLIFSTSEEFGSTHGLDIIPGKVVRFNGRMKVPHMGWNKVTLKGTSVFLNDIPSYYFYFIHSYYPVVSDESWILGITDYEGEFTCIVGKDNLIATQFHPEKSHQAGLKIIENFVKTVED